MYFLLESEDMAFDGSLCCVFVIVKVYQYQYYHDTPLYYTTYLHGQGFLFSKHKKSPLDIKSLYRVLFIEPSSLHGRTPN